MAAFMIVYFFIVCIAITVFSILSIVSYCRQLLLMNWIVLYRFYVAVATVTLTKIDSKERIQGTIHFDKEYVKSKVYCIALQLFINTEYTPRLNKLPTTVV